jgi:hypothetical protein
MKKLLAVWRSTSEFQIPDKVVEYLHPEPFGIPRPGYWYIQYNEFYYIDKEGHGQRIKGSKIVVNELECKNPSFIFGEEEKLLFKS